MKSKNLALTNGIVGLVGGIILLFGGWFIAGGIVSDAATGSVSNTSGEETPSATAWDGFWW